MNLQQLLDITNLVLCETQINHRNTLQSHEQLHDKLGEIKDLLYGLIDSIGEYIIITGGYSKFNKIEQSDLPTKREDIHIYSVELIEVYLDNLKDFYTSCEDLEMQSYLIDKTKELRIEWNKLKSVCPKMENEVEKD